MPVPEILRQYAIKLRDTQKKYVWEVGKRDLPCNPSHFRSKFSEALSAIDGVRVLTPHCCRHTYVSIMQSIGVDLGTIQSIVGHATLDMTKHYLHVQDSVRQDAINRFSAAFDANLNNSDDPAPEAAESPREVMEPIESLGNVIYFPNKKKA